MGNVSSRSGDGEGLQLRDQSRFSIASVVISNSSRTLLNVTPNAFPASRFNVKRDIGDDSIVEYVQDPESALSSGPPAFLLRLSNDDTLTFTFTFVLRQSTAFSNTPAATNGTDNPAIVPIDTNVSNLTYICTSGTRELEQLVNVEFHADPNLHKNPKVQLVGDFTTGGSPSVQAQWSWTWKPPKPTEDRGGGWRNSCSFVEYDQRAHRLNTLATFAFWVQNTRLPRTPNLLLPPSEMNTPQRLRLPSNQSMDSRLSESDVEMGREPQSPVFDAIPENNLGLIPSIPTIKSDSTAPTRTGDEPASQEPNDLLFQAAKRDFEQRTSNIRARWKKVLKKAETALDTKVVANNAMSELMDALRETFAANGSNALPNINLFFDKTAKDLLSYERSTTVQMKNHIIDPITKLYNIDIKGADARRKDFDEKEKEYNAWVRWYLGKTETSLKEKKRAETDIKYQAKKKNFELKRFDYSSFIEDLQGGRKDQEVFHHLFQYAEAQTSKYLDTAHKIEQMRPQHDALRLEIKQANDEFDLQRRQREEKRRALEVNSKGLGEQTASPSLGNHASLAQPTVSRSLSEDPTHNSSTATPRSVSMVPSIPGQTPSAPTGSTLSAYEKEGVLYALSRPGSHADPKGLNKQAWHKFWIVLNQGKLLEYANWKVAPELQMTIDLRVARVQEARNAERRFCLEVQTPNFTRVYQDTSDEGVKSWIGAIQNAIQNALEAHIDKPAPDGSSDQNLNIATALTGKPSKHYSLSGNRMSYQGGTPKSSNAPSRYNTTGGNLARPTIQDQAVSPLLQKLREADQDNLYCADCCSADKNDWVSLNLGIIICFQCSGVHRGLSRDVSKIASLTLDTTPFTPDVVELLTRIGNRNSNNVWEAKLDRAQQIGPFCTEEQRKQFIIAKYKKKAFVRKLPEAMPHVHSPVEPLVMAVKKNDLQGVVYALAVPKSTDTDENAEVTAAIKFRKEAVDPSRKTSVVYLALAAADPASPAATASPLHSPNPAINRLSNSIRKLFTVAELLLQNGFEIPVEDSPFPLSPSAKLYLEQKKGQRSGIPPPLPVTDGADEQYTALPPLPQPSNDRSRSDGKLQKRISTTNRLTKPPGIP
ncbi:ArfGap-domain-containing protein [Pseudovirgaria hyperparasitica]|uniref:ADP-ribosylation factor GTPase-activating protein n=1 Tax=Pseudovirgaria hyperparasitica TaxID=470096 RepID=A0A6A6WBU3_9PEZI|nr:ArfGap-domain-containing protein [Pseudovirgaria hyperparasitica]KAF2759306.1 ArfGap-domain-containing protein [Pseudovirgaria hyperparasitica]